MDKTILITDVLSEGVQPDLTRSLMEHELSHNDVNRFTTLARRRRPVARLSMATAGRLERSHRYRHLYAPNGYGDELRAVFRTGSACWGQVCLTREAGDRHFSTADVAAIARLLPHIANALRVSLAVRAPERPAAPDEHSALAPGVLILDPDNDIESLDNGAARWLRELPDNGLGLPTVVHAVARHARLLAAGVVAGPSIARARTRRGGYLIVRGTCLSSSRGDAPRVAVVLEPPRPSELTPILFSLGDLTPREQEIAQLLARGVNTSGIARLLWISSHTLRGHIKAIFGKLGVGSRAEFSALLLHERLTSGTGEPGVPSDLGTTR